MTFVNITLLCPRLPIHYQAIECMHCHAVANNFPHFPPNLTPNCIEQMHYYRCNENQHSVWERAFCYSTFTNILFLGKDSLCWGYWWHLTCLTLSCHRLDGLAKWINPILLEFENRLQNGHLNPEIWRKRDAAGAVLLRLVFVMELFTWLKTGFKQRGILHWIGIRNRSATQMSRSWD